jgi:hypothetical protein
MVVGAAAAIYEQAVVKSERVVRRGFGSNHLFGISLEGRASSRNARPTSLSEATWHRSSLND